MRVSGTTVLAAPPERVMAVLRDPARLVEALPNVGDLDWDREEDGSFTVTIRPALVLGEVPIKTHWRPRAGDERSLSFAIEGRTDEQRIGMLASLVVSESEGASSAAWNVEFETTGAMAAAGQRTLEAIVGAQAEAVLLAVAAA